MSASSLGIGYFFPRQSQGLPFVVKTIHPPRRCSARGMRCYFEKVYTVQWRYTSPFRSSGWGKSGWCTASGGNCGSRHTAQRGSYIAPSFPLRRGADVLPDRLGGAEVEGRFRHRQRPPRGETTRRGLQIRLRCQRQRVRHGRTAAAAMRRR